MSAVPVFSPLQPQPRPHHVQTRFDARANALWVTMPEREDGSAPYFSPVMLQEISSLLHAMAARGVSWPAGGELQPVHYTVLKSAHPDYFSLGGDLAYFHECIKRRDR